MIKDALTKKVNDKVKINFKNRSKRKKKQLKNNNNKKLTNKTNGLARANKRKRIEKREMTRFRENES